MENSLHKDITTHYFETTAGASHENSLAHYEFAAKQWKRHLGPWLPGASAHCLDIACGCGEVLFLLEKQGITRAKGVDLSLGEIEAAKPFVKSPIVREDLVKYLSAQGSASLDNVFALNILEHLSEENLYSVMKECRRVLKPGGTLIAMVPNAGSPFGGMTRYWDITHQRAFTLSSLTQLARISGFGKPPEFRECAPRPHGLVSSVRWLLWQGVRALILFHHLILFGNSKGRIYSADMLVRLHV